MTYSNSELNFFEFSYKYAPNEKRNTQTPKTISSLSDLENIVGNLSNQVKENTISHTFDTNQTENSLVNDHISLDFYEDKKLKNIESPKMDDPIDLNVSTTKNLTLETINNNITNNSIPQPSIDKNILSILEGRKSMDNVLSLDGEWPMFSLTTQKSSLGEIKLSMLSESPISLDAIVEGTQGEQRISLVDNLDIYGIFSTKDGLTISLNFLPRWKRITVVSRVGGNGVLKAYSNDFDWERSMQLENNPDREAQIFCHIYNVYGRIIFREFSVYYSNFREMAIDHSYEELKWISDNTPVKSNVTPKY